MIEDSFFDVFEEFEIVGIGLLGFEVLAFGVEVSVDFADMSFHLGVGNRAFVLENIHSLESAKIVNVIVPVVKSKVSSVLNSHFG